MRNLQRVHRVTIPVSVLGLLVLAGLVVDAHRFTTADALRATLLLAPGVIAGELAPLKIPRRGDDAAVTVSTTFAFALLLSGGLLPAIGSLVAGSLIQDVHARKPLSRIAFNIGQYTLALAAAAAVLALAGLPHDHGRPFASSELVVILVAAIVSYTVNTLIVGVAISTHKDMRALVYFRRDFWFSLTTGMVLLCMSPIVVAAMWFGPALVPLFVFPLLAVHQGGRQAARAQHQATHDALTDLPNGSMFRFAVDQAIGAARSGVANVVVMLMDLDRFKQINDTLGHHHGDHLLQVVGPRLREAADERGGLVGRLGGDEFALMLPNLSDMREAAMAAEHFRALLGEPVDVAGIPLEVDASLGIARYPQDAPDVEGLLRCADAAMYIAKETRCGHLFYEPGYERDNRADIELVPELRHGIDRGELLLEYQPKVELATGTLYGVEALVRWEHPERGRLSPAVFVPLAENTGLISPLTSFVLETGIRQCAEWHRRGLPLTVSVNISVRSLLMADLAGQIREILERHDVDPRWIELEITESTMMADPARAMTVLTELSEIGLGLSVDDFGTGYSSLAYLKDLPVGEIKIDRSFVTPMVESRETAVIVQSTIEIARNLGLRVVAEGVEDQGTLDALTALGCHSAQGFYLSRPVPAERINLDMADHAFAPPSLAVAV